MLFQNWMNQLLEPTAIFDQSLPTYQGVTKIISKIKSSGSLSPHDHMSIIMLKRCAFLRTALHRIISHCWKKQTFHKTWKYAFTTLVYKKKRQESTVELQTNHIAASIRKSVLIINTQQNLQIPIRE